MFIRPLVLCIVYLHLYCCDLILEVLGYDKLSALGHINLPCSAVAYW